jgi:hypothetical protein
VAGESTRAWAQEKPGMPTLMPGREREREREREERERCTVHRLL